MELNQPADNRGPRTNVWSGYPIRKENFNGQLLSRTLLSLNTVQRITGKRATTLYTISNPQTIPDESLLASQTKYPQKQPGESVLIPK